MWNEKWKDWGALWTPQLSTYPYLRLRLPRKDDGQLETWGSKEWARQVAWNSQTRWTKAKKIELVQKAKQDNVCLQSGWGRAQGGNSTRAMKLGKQKYYTRNLLRNSTGVLILIVRAAESHWRFCLLCFCSFVCFSVLFCVAENGTQELVHACYFTSEMHSPWSST